MACSSCVGDWDCVFDEDQPELCKCSGVVTKLREKNPHSSVQTCDQEPSNELMSRDDEGDIWSWCEDDVRGLDFELKGHNHQKQMYEMDPNLSTENGMRIIQQVELKGNNQEDHNVEEAANLGCSD